MSIEQLISATQAMNNLTEWGNSFLANADQAIADRQNAYDNIASNLLNNINNRMVFSALIDPTDEAPTNKDTGVYNTIKEAIDASPSGAFVLCALKSGIVHESDDIVVSNRSVFIAPQSGGTRVFVNVPGYASSTHNSLRAFSLQYGGRLFAAEIDFLFPSERFDPALGWSALRSLVRYSAAQSIDVGFNNCTFTTALTEDVLSLTSCVASCCVTASLYASTLDGNLSIATNVNSGTARLSLSALTLQNGAKIDKGDTVSAGSLVSTI